MIETSGTPGMNDVINASLREIARLAGENSAIGTPIETTAGITVIPVAPSAGAQSVDRIAALIENAPDLLRRLKGAFFSR